MKTEKVVPPNAQDERRQIKPPALNAVRSIALFGALLLSGCATNGLPHPNPFDDIETINAQGSFTDSTGETVSAGVGVKLRDRRLPHGFAK